MINSKSTCQALKRNDLTGQADTRGPTRTILPGDMLSVGLFQRTEYSANQAGTLPCPKTQMRWFMISCFFFRVSVPTFSTSLLLSITMTWVHLARLSLGIFASPFGSKTFPGMSACFICLVKGTITTVWNLLRLMESRCTTTTGLLSRGSDPLEG